MTLRISVNPKLPNVHALVIIIILIAFLFTVLYRQSIYDEKTYNCRYMSRDLENILEGQLGIDTQIIVAWNSDYSAGHMWIRIGGVDIDSVSLIPYILTLEYTENTLIFNNYSDWLEYSNLTV